MRYNCFVAWKGESIKGDHMKKTILAALILLLAVPASASVWKEHWLSDDNHTVRASFTSERLTPTIGREQGGMYAGKLYIEVFSVDRAGTCPNVTVGQVLPSGQSVA